jgi:hypothetical protein
MAKSDQANSPEVEHRLAVTAKNNDAQAEHREALKQALDDELAQAQARHDRAMALAAPVQKVTDGNETAALATITGQAPIRDLSDAPPPNELGPHESGEALFEAEQAAAAKADKG